MIHIVLYRTLQLVSEKCLETRSGSPCSFVDLIHVQYCLDGVVSVHTLPDLQLISQLAKTRGCQAYAIDRPSPDGTGPSTFRLCAAMKKKLLVLEWNGADFAETKELSIPDSVKVICWAGKSLCVGFKNEYNMIDVATGNFSPVQGLKPGAPLLYPLPNKQILINMDAVTVFVTHDGKPARKYGLSWSEPPVALAYSFPYVIAIVSKAVEVRLVFGSSSLVQSIPLAGAKCIAAATSAGGRRRTGGTVFVASKTNIWALTPIALGSQVDQLVKEGDYEEALSLCENLDSEDMPDKEEKLKSIRLLFAYHLFNQGQYTRAMQYFLDLNTDVVQVVGLFPQMLPTDLTSTLRYPFAVTPLAGAALTKALQSLIQYLVQKRSQLIPQQQPAAVASAAPASSAPVVDAKEWNQVTDSAIIVDTCLLKAYLRTTNPLLSSLLRLHNVCHVGESENVLIGDRKFSELVLLYKGKNLHENSLKVLQKLGSDDKSPQPHLAGPMPSVEYMKALGREQLPLIFKYSPWILQKAPESGILIFTADRGDETALPPVDTLKHLKSQLPTGTAEFGEISQRLIVEFLEFVILDKHDQTPALHDELVEQYFKFVLMLKRNQPNKSKPVVAGSEGGLLGKYRTRLVSFLEQSEFYQPHTFLSHIEFNEEGLYEEKAILLSRCGEHELALKEYCWKLNDLDQAEQYCVKHYQADTQKGKDVYLHLLDVLLDPQAPDTTRLSAFAFEILSRHYADIDVPAALERLPSTTAVTKLYDFFQNVWRTKNQIKRDAQVIMNIRKSEMMKVKKELYKLRAKAIKVGEETKCDMCFKTIGEAVFVYLPTGEVIHYRCYNKLKGKQQQQQTSSSISNQ
jgi:Vam6/Vps39-like protein vacuolar protein sorting-associated protein 39